MLVRFVQDACGETYRVLSENEAGAWLISHSSPAAPLFATTSHMSQMTRIEMPRGFQVGTRELTDAQRTRMKLIEPLLADEGCICQKRHRRELAEQSAKIGGTTTKRVLTLYYRYLATGKLIEPRKRQPLRKNDNFDWAIRTYYYSAKRHSLRDAYELLILERYMGPSGEVAQSAPTFAAFHHYFYRHGYDRDPQKVIAREGLTAYQRNHRPVFGMVNDWQPLPGAYMMDATEADIFLVSRLDRSVVIGRPIVYLAVDAATQLICGVYVGLENDSSSSVIKCLANAARDKTELCSKYGISINREMWPCQGLPSRIITDNGGEFISTRVQELCRRYGIEIESLPPFRPDLKGCVEKTFDLIQERFKSLLRGKGVIENDAQERWSVDYRAQAVLDLEQFTSVVLHCVVYLNSGRLLSDGKTPALHWLDSHSNLLEVDVEEFRRLALPRKTIKLTRKGFRLNGMTYAPESMNGLRIGDDCELAYDLADLSSVYVVLDEGWIFCSVVGGKPPISKLEQDTQQKTERAVRRRAKEDELAASIATTQKIKTIVDAANRELEPITIAQSGGDIRENRNAERRRMT